MITYKVKHDVLKEYFPEKIFSFNILFYAIKYLNFISRNLFTFAFGFLIAVFIVMVFLGFFGALITKAILFKMPFTQIIMNTLKSNTIITIILFTVILVFGTLMIVFVWLNERPYVLRDMINDVRLLKENKHIKNPNPITPDRFLFLAILKEQGYHPNMHKQIPSISNSQTFAKIRKKIHNTKINGEFLITKVERNDYKYKDWNFKIINSNLTKKQKQIIEKSLHTLWQILLNKMYSRKLR